MILVGLPNKKNKFFCQDLNIHYYIIIIHINILENYKITSY